MYLTRFRRRIVAALLATAVGLATVGGPALAAESDDGLDTEQLSAATVGETTVFGIDAGSLLNLRLLGEDGLAGINEVDGVFEALTRLVPLDIVSSLPALNALSIPAVEARSTDGEQRTEAEAPSLADGLPGPVAGLLDGNIVASLLALVDDAGAKGLTEATVSNLSVLAGLIGLESITTNLGGDVTSQRAAGSRSVTVDQITALDLTGLLDLLGLDLLDLSLEQLTGLADGLGVLDGVLGAIPGLSVGDLDTLLSDPLSLLGALETARTDANGGLLELAAICDTLGGLGLGDLCDGLTEITELIDELTAQIGILEDLLDLVPSLVDQLLGVLDGAPLLAFGGIDAGVFATAARTVEDSVADIDATIGEVLVAGTVLPGLDLGSTLAQVNALSSQVTGILDGVLGVLGLEGLIDIGVLETTTSVDEVDGVITALAELTGLRITITPPDVCALLAGIDPTGTVTGLLGQLDATLPDLPVPVVGDLLAGLNGGVNCSGVQAFAPGQVADLVTALSQPLTIEVANISETSTLDVAATASPATPGKPGTPDKDLARTGGDIPLLPVLAFMLVGGYALRFLVRRSRL